MAIVTKGHTSSHKVCACDTKPDNGKVEQEAKSSTVKPEDFQEAFVFIHEEKEAPLFQNGWVSILRDVALKSVNAKS
ncbi:MAG: hypothetical protein RR373_01435 [Akkermansia sp.]